MRCQTRALSHSTFIAAKAFLNLTPVRYCYKANAALSGECNIVFLKCESCVGITATAFARVCFGQCISLPLSCI